MNEASSSSSKATFGWPFSWALNRLLAAEPWARERLAPFAGRSVEVRNPPFPALRFTILPGGMVEAGGDEPALVVTLKPDAFLHLARGREHFLAGLDVAGEAAFAAAARSVAQHLRWDVEEDLSRIFGDIIAHRLGESGRALAAWHRDAARRLAHAFADYAVDEERMLMARSEWQSFARDVVELRDALARLEKRIARLG